MHLHLASHLGTLDEPREGHYVESNLKMVFGGPISKVEGLSKCLTLDVTKTEQPTEQTQF